MSQTRLVLTAPTGEARKAYDILERLFEDDGLPLAIFEIDSKTDLSEVSVYAADDDGAILERMRAAIVDLPGSPEITVETLPDVDWVAHSLEGLRAVRAGRFLVHGAHQVGGRKPHEIGIEVEAGLAFGTGHHGTTAGCLEMISEIARRERPRNALDLGTGSGVLAIALSKLARVPVVATDIDPVAVGVARRNIRLNEVPARIRTATAAGFHHPVFRDSGPFDLIVANILARPLMALAPHMARIIEPDGSLILSGILERQRSAVLAAYVGQRFRHRRTIIRDGWVTLHLKR